MSAKDLKEKIKNTKDINNEIIHIEAWDCDIEIRTISAKQRANILDNVADDEGNIYHDGLRMGMIINSCFDPESGEQLFEEEDKEWLLEKSFGPIEIITSKILKLSKLSKNALEDSEKNLDSETQKGDFITS